MHLHNVNLKPFKPFFHQLISHNRLYRIFLLIVSFTWGNDWLTGLIFFFSLLLILDSQFRNYCLAVRSRYYQKKELKEARETKLIKKRLNIPENQTYFQAFWEGIVSGIKYLFNRSLPYITRLPIIEDYWQENLNHYQYRNYLKFKNILETTSHKINVIYTEGDQYHITFYIRLIKPLTPTKAKIKINQAIKKYFGEIPAGVIIKLKRTTGEILIPIDLVKQN